MRDFESRASASSATPANAKRSENVFSISPADFRSAIVDLISSATMIPRHSLSRRAFLAAAAAAPLAAAAKSRRIPVGLELYSVREELKNDLMGTVRGV